MTGNEIFNEIHIMHNTPPARILFAIGVDGKLKSHLEWPNMESKCEDLQKLTLAMATFNHYQPTDVQ